jgi:hypothetical protein
MTDWLTDLATAHQGVRWDDMGDGNHWLYHQGTMVGEVYPRSEGWRWHCKTSDWREICDNLDLAKARCERSFWHNAWIDVQAKAREMVKNTV